MKMDSAGMPLGPGRLPSGSMVESLGHAINSIPVRTAIVCDGDRLNYLEFGRAAAGLARLLTSCVVRRRPLAVVMPNSIELSVSVFAVWLAGAQVTLLNPNYTAAELRPLLGQSGATAIIVKDGVGTAAESVASELGLDTVGVRDDDIRQWSAESGLGIDQFDYPDSDQLATMMFTGGTTGIPKPVNHTHGNLLLTVRGMEACWPTRLGDTWLNVAPSFHIWGLLMGLLNPVYGYATVVLSPFVPEQVVLEMQRHRVGVFGGGPAQIYAGILAAIESTGAELPCLRVCPGGGSPFTADLHQRWFRTTGLRIHEAYGMTEIAPISCNPSDKPPLVGSVGVPAPLIELRIVGPESSGTRLPVGEPGEIQVRAPHMTIDAQGSGNGIDRAEFERPWFDTGDMGYLDSEGNLHIVDRKKDMIIVGGYNVFPREIDEVLTRHQDVLEAATVGAPDVQRGERAVSFVVLTQGSAIDEAALFRYCSGSLAKYKLPREILFVDALPRTPANKIDRRALRQRLPGAGRPS